MGERDRTMRRDLQDRMYEERAAKLAEIEYSRRINVEQNNNNQMLGTWKDTVQGHWIVQAFWLFELNISTSQKTKSTNTVQFITKIDSPHKYTKPLCRLENILH